MIGGVLDDVPTDEIDLLFIENVGNLVCPVGFDLGENAKVTVLSVTEGDDKPAKYPGAFRKSRATVLNKTDLLQYTDVSMETVQHDILTINPGTRVIAVSSRSGEGVPDWVDWLEATANEWRGSRE